MPRPANPGWRAKTMKLSNEVIEAVWVRSAYEGTSPGRVVNDLLAEILLKQPQDSKEQQSAAPPSSAT